MILIKNLSGILYSIFSGKDFTVLGSYSFPDLTQRVGFYLYESLKEFFPELQNFKTRVVESRFYWAGRTEEILEDLSEVRKKYAMKVLQSSFSRGIEVSDLIVYFLQDFELLRGTCKSSHPEKEGIVVYEEKAKKFLMEVIENKYRSLVLSGKVKEVPISSVRIFSSKREMHLGDWDSKNSVVWDPDQELIYTLPATIFFQDLLDFVEFDEIEIITSKLSLVLNKESVKRFFDVVNAALLPLVFRPMVITEKEFDLKDLIYFKRKVPKAEYFYMVEERTNILRVHFKEDFILAEEPAGLRVPKAFKVVFPVNLKMAKIRRKDKEYKVRFIGRFSSLNDSLINDVIKEIIQENN